MFAITTREGVIRLRKSRWDKRKGKQYRDIGTYTLIPTMMVVGPVMGYLLGSLVEKKWGHDPWPTTIGALFGFLAAARQIWIILTRGSGKR
jgi:F0F1-type ATP synthase assembly protein I